MVERRRYSTGLRIEQSLLARRRILGAASELFTERGYAGTTLQEIAASAGVSVQTVYNQVGGKPALLKAVYDVTLAGDDDPVPMAQRPIARAVIEATDARQCLARYAEMARVLGERTLPLATTLLAQAATGDPDLHAFVDTIEQQRATGTSAIAQHIATRFGLRDGIDTQTAADILWTLTAPELADRLVRRRGWRWDRYQHWLAATMADTLLYPAP